MADSLAVKEGEAASPAIQPDYREIGRSLGEQLRTKERKIGIIADWKMSEAVQSEISGLKEALEGSGSEIHWCIYRRKEQNIVERIGAEKGQIPLWCWMPEFWKSLENRQKMENTWAQSSMVWATV